MRVQITLRSGAQIEFDSEEVKTNQDLDGSVSTFKWATPPAWQRKLHFVDPTQIVAVVIIREAPEE